ncbi:MAG: flagellar hook-basal body complex protein [Chloroflexi bacterium]|nr:flagellar hook-basal body complex protein [Chloroflexota bacterium]
MPYSLLGALNISKQDLLNRLRDLDVTSSNLANVNTAGYKANRSNFQEMLNQQLEEGMRLAATQLLPMQGSLRSSDKPLDWAIQGEGFFSVTLPNGDTGYTRDGQFMLDAERNLVNANGYPLVWEGEIPEDATDIIIRSNGTVTALNADGESADIGAVQLARFPNPSGLTSYGDNVWLESDASGAAQAGEPGTENFGVIASHKVEESNVDLAQELTRLMTLQRSFSMSLAAFQQTDAMISQAINLRKA